MHIFQRARACPPAKHAGQRFQHQVFVEGGEGDADAFIISTHIQFAGEGENTNAPGKYSNRFTIEAMEDIA